MRISHLSITNFAGIATLEVDLPPVALISGDNGVGKSSFLDALKYPYERGHNPDVIRAGAEYAEVIVTHDDGYQVKARATRKTNETVRSWKAPGSKRFVVTREYIDKVANAVSYDPLAFLEKPEKEQLATLLELMPPKVDPAALKAALGEVAAEIGDTDGLNDLDIIRRYEKTIYDARTGENGAAKTQEAHAGQLDSAAGPAPTEGGDMDAEVRRLTSEHAQLKTQLDAEIKDLGDSLQATKDRCQATERTESDAAEAEYGEAKSAAMATYNAAVAAAENRRSERKAKAKEVATAAIEHARSIANAEVNKQRAELGPKMETLTKQIAAAQERARFEVQAAATRKAAAVARQQAKVHREKSEGLSAALDRLAALRASVVLPIPGITFDEGRIVDAKGVPLCQWNEQSQLTFALRIAVLAHGDAGFIVMDRSNGIVGMKWEGVLKTAKKYAESEGLQFVIARASAGKSLTVEDLTQ